MAIVGLALAGCGTRPQAGGDAREGSITVSPSNSDTGQDQAAGQDEPSSGTPTPSESRPAPRVGGAEPLSSDQLLDLAVTDLSGRTGLPREQIAVARADAVTWPDGALGCPQPGMAYISMLSPGHLFVLEAGGTTYEYHAGRRGAPFLCEDPQPPLPSD